MIATPETMVHDVTQEFQALIDDVWWTPLSRCHWRTPTQRAAVTRTLAHGGRRLTRVYAHGAFPPARPQPG